MGLLVDEIVDIVDDPLDIEVTSERPGVLGSAVIKGVATEVDRRLALPAAGFRPALWPHRAARDAQRRLLLVDDQAFFRNLLARSCRAAGYAVVPARRCCRGAGT